MAHSRSQENPGGLANYPPDALINLGPVFRQMLAAAGIRTVGQVRKLGAVEKYWRVKQIDSRASLNFLWGLAAGLVGMHWTKLSRETRGELLLALDARVDRERNKI